MEIQPITEGYFYHIYNRGINSENIFKEPRNYDYFITQYTKYCSAVFDTYAYALLKNHFHLLVYVKENVIALSHKDDGIIQLSASKQLSHFFNSYAQSINKAYGRTGSLFESPFERRLIDNEKYLTNVILYCHYNPQHHEFVSDFKAWNYTSYNTILKDDNTFLSAQKVIDWFGNKEVFKKAHEASYDETLIKKYIIE
jgi:putative transposase